MEFTLGQITIYKADHDAAPSPPASPAPPAIPAIPAIPKHSKVYVGKDGSVSIEDDNESIQAAPPTHRNSSSHSDSGGGDTVAIVFIVFVFGYLMVKAIVNAFARNSGKGHRLSAEEQATLEKLQRTLAQMESRVESLETILVESRRSKESYGTKF